MEDGDIVELFLSRDESALRHTSEKYGKRLRRLSYGIVRDAQTAEECENDTYVKAWNAIPPHSPKDHLYAFLARITRNVSLNRCRDSSRLKRSVHICELSAEMEQCIPVPDDCQCRLDDMAFADMMNSFLASLTPECRRIFVRSYWYLDSVADISKRFALSESKVKTTLYRCRNKLREHLKKEDHTI